MLPMSGILQLQKNDLREGGKFTYRMEAKDGSFGFDFSGVYGEVDDNKQITFILDDGRKVKVTFTANGSETKVEEIFEAELQILSTYRETDGKQY